MLVALTVTPALALILLRKAPRRAARVAAGRWLQRGYDRAAVAHRAAAAPRLRRRFAVVVGGPLVVPQLGQSLFPDVQGARLPHPLDRRARHVRRRRSDRIVTSGQPRSCRPIPGVRNFGSHIGQALLGEEVAGVNFGENWISIDPKADYDKTLARDPRGRRRATPALYRDVLTYLNERIEEVLTGAKEPIVVRIYGEDLEVLRSKADEVQHELAGIDGIVERARGPAGRHAADPGRGRSRQGREVRAQTGRRPPGGRHPGRRRGGRRHLPRRQGLRRGRVEHAADAQQRRSISDLPIDTPVGRRCVRSATWPR